MPIPRVAIIGGGIAGLAAAWELERWSREGGFCVDVYEASDRFGGPIQTDLSSGLVLEGGPDSFLTTKPDALDLCTELGLADALIGTRPSTRGAFIYRGNRLHRIPALFGSPARAAARSLLSNPLLSVAGRLRAAAGLALARLAPIPIGDDVALGPRLRCRFGREAVDWLFEPFVAGVHPAPLDVLSTAAVHRVLPDRWTAAVRVDPPRGPAHRDPSASAQQAHDHRFATPFVALSEGMEQLPRALMSRFQGTRPHARHRASAITQEDGRYLVRFENEPAASADAIILATSAAVAGQLLLLGLPGVAQELARVRFSDVIVVALVFDRSDIPGPLNGTGILVPRRTGLPISAITWLSSKWERPDPTGRSIVLRVFVRSEGSAATESSDAEWLAHAARGLRVTMGIRMPPRHAVVFRHHGTLAWYSVGHARLVEEIRRSLDAWPRVELAGSSYDGIGLPDAIRSGRAAARRVGAALGPAP